MTMSKVCPKCGSNWPKGNFCPKDGTALIDARPQPAPKVAKADDEATRIDRPIIRAEPPRGRRAAASEAKTRLDTPALNDDGSLMTPRRSKPTMPKPPKMVTPSEAQPSDEQKPAAKPEGEAPASGGRGVRQHKGFSETQWFMKGMEVDADLLEMVDDEEYDRDESISESERKGFTLRRDDES